jgi:hypothetical protein
VALCESGCEETEGEATSEDDSTMARLEALRTDSHEEEEEDDVLARSETPLGEDEEDQNGGDGGDGSGMLCTLSRDLVDATFPPFRPTSSPPSSAGGNDDDGAAPALTTPRGSVTGVRLGLGGGRKDMETEEGEEEDDGGRHGGGSGRTGGGVHAGSYGLPNQHK